MLLILVATALPLVFSDDSLSDHTSVLDAIHSTSTSYDCDKFNAMSDADKIALVDQIDFESLTSLSYTFVDCDITSVVSQLEQANVTFITEFVSMFENAIIEGGSTSLDLSNWDIDDEANVNNMFDGAENLADDTCWWPPLKTDAYDWLPRAHVRMRQHVHRGLRSYF